MLIYPHLHSLLLLLFLVLLWNSFWIEPLIFNEKLFHMKIIDSKISHWEKNFCSKFYLCNLFRKYLDKLNAKFSKILGKLTNKKLRKKFKTFLSILIETVATNKEPLFYIELVWIFILRSVDLEKTIPAFQSQRKHKAFAYCVLLQNISIHPLPYFKSTLNPK